MPRCYQLVGVPGSGKSTWLANQLWTLGVTVVSTDAFVEHYAATQGKTYTEVFEHYMPTAVNLMAEQVVFAREHGHDIIWDQTSTTEKSRARKFRMLPDHEHIAVVFATPPLDELHRRLASRVGKHIPRHVLDSMIASWQDPTEAEGFVEIWLT